MGNKSDSEPVDYMPVKKFSKFKKGSKRSAKALPEITSGIETMIPKEAEVKTNSERSANQTSETGSKAATPTATEEESHETSQKISKSAAQNNNLSQASSNESDENKMKTLQVETPQEKNADKPLANTVPAKSTHDKQKKKGCCTIT